MNRRFSTFLIILIFVLKYASAQQKIIAIWPSKAPGSESRIDSEKIVNERYYNVYQSDLRIFPAENPDGNKPAVLIFAGGGYSHIAIIKEGYKTAEWLNSIGISAFVLKYRLNRVEALADAERALSLIRSKAGEFNINPDNIGVIGFSAGGHLALNLAIHSSNPERKMYDRIDSSSCKPDFIILGYPQADTLAEARLLTKNIPPVFLFHASNDKTVTVETSIKLYLNLHSLGIPIELHIFEKGGHGFGLGEKPDPSSFWTLLCENWLRFNSILK